MLQNGENNGTALPADTGNGAPGANGLPTQAEPPQTVEAQPQGLTQADLAKVVEDFERELAETKAKLEESMQAIGQKESQRFFDQKEVGKRLKSLETATAALVAAGTLDEAQRAVILADAKTGASLDVLIEGLSQSQDPVSQGDGGAPRQQAPDPAQQYADAAVRGAGLDPDHDPEMALLHGHQGWDTWTKALIQASQAKQQRLAAQSQPQQPQNPEPQAPQVEEQPQGQPADQGTQQPPTGGPVVGTSVQGAPPTGTPTVEDIDAAAAKANYAEVERLRDELFASAKGG
jgi:hypothetical protein